MRPRVNGQEQSLDTPISLSLTLRFEKKSSSCYLVSDLRTRIKKCTLPPPPKWAPAPPVEALPSLASECNWIRAHFFLNGQLLFLFLSSLHVISLTFSSVAYDKSNWPSLHSPKDHLFYFQGLFPPLLAQSWTHKNKCVCVSPPTPPKMLVFFFFGGARW